MSKNARAQRAASPAHRKPRQRRTTKKDAPKFAEELKVAEEHERQLNGEYAALLQEQQRVNGELDRVRILANQVAGRLDTLRELRGEKDPLPSVAELLAKQSPDATAALETVKKDGDGG